ncbi:hypothetical protein OIU84_004630 [Salix udensis]|uniref:Uncharacterized protein n=1 Tax=Salix udensis TaxID=889485 RepID=A0AAD6K2M7_9ROSI|nr:hypothetical protein OIU84_004630 [Salix udensis]
MIIFLKSTSLDRCLALAVQIILSNAKPKAHWDLIRLSKFPVSVDHPHDKGDDSKSSLRLTKDVKEWEQIRCPICMEHPHNAVLLQCSSFGKGCRPYMCNTSYRHSNCLDQFLKSNVSSPFMEILHEIPSVSSRAGEELQLLGQTGHYESEPQPKLCCLLCRGQIMDRLL